MLLPVGVRAESTFSLQLKFGFSGLTIYAISKSETNGTLSLSTQTKDAGLGTEVGPEISYLFPNLNAASSFIYQTRVNSDVGSFPLTRVGFGFFYYPLGLPTQVSLLDNGVKVERNVFAPYVGLRLMVASVAVTDTSSGSTGAVSFNAVSFVRHMVGGMEIPVKDELSAIIEASLERNLLGSPESTGVSSVGDNALVFVEAFNVMTGVSLHL